MSSVRILSIDGGGIKGIISAKLLVQLEQYLKKYSYNPNVKIADYFDLIAGTSTGSILTALYLCPGFHETARYSANDVLDFYLKYGSDIFQKNLFYPLLGSKYKGGPLKQLLQQYFSNLYISDLGKPCLLTAYDVTQRKTLFFNSLSGKKDPARDYLVSEAVLASTAAPSYFPPIRFPVAAQKYDGLIDGGVFANNPSMCALIEALKLTSFKHMEDILFLSVGNASQTHSYPYESIRWWGLFQWALPILDILMDSSEQTVSYQMEQLFHSMQLSNQYLRLHYQTNERVPAMDDSTPASIEILLSMADKILKKEALRLESFAKKLVRNAIE